MNSFHRGWGDLLGSLGGLLVLVLLPTLLLILLRLPSGRRFDGGDAVLRHGLAKDGRIHRGRQVFWQQVSAGRQRRPAEGELFKIAADLFPSATAGCVKRLDERLTTRRCSSK
jgi:hypothetical protein